MSDFTAFRRPTAVPPRRRARAILLTPVVFVQRMGVSRVQKQGIASEPPRGHPRRDSSCRCSPRPRPKRPERSTSASPREESSDAQDLQGMAAARVRTDRFMIQWRRVQPTQGPPSTGAQPDRIVGGLASHGIRPVPFVWGSPQWVRPGPSRPPVNSAFAQTAWQNFLKAAVARYGPGGSYWANGYRQQYGASATPLPIQSWQVWNEPNLKKYFDPGNDRAWDPEVRPAGEDLPRRDQEPGSASQDRPRRNARQRAAVGLGLPQRPVQDARVQEQLRRRRPAPLYGLPGRVPPADSAIPRGDDESRRRRNAAVADRVRLGIGVPPTASASTRASRVRRRCSETPSSCS